MVARRLSTISRLPMGTERLASVSVDRDTATAIEVESLPATLSERKYKPNLYAAASVVSLAGWLFGFDTGSIGPVTEMEYFYPLSAGLQGFVVATILLTALIFSTPSGPLSDRISRLHTISIGAFIFALGSALCAGSNSLGMFLAGRALAGSGEGLFLSVAGVWLVECAPRELRGRIGCMIQSFIVCGLTGGYFVCYGSSSLMSDWQWRIPYCCQAATAVFLGIGVQTRIVPESPRWLLVRSNKPHLAIPIIEAFAISTHSAQIEKEELLLRTEREREERLRASDVGRKRTLSEKFGVEGIPQCFEKKEDRRWKTITAIILQGLQQLSGIDAILFYAPIVFSAAGLSSRQGSFLASGITGIVGIVVTIPCQIWVMDRMDRRTATILGGIGQGICMLGIGIIFASGLASKYQAARFTVIGLIYVFIAVFQMTWSIAIKVFCNEIQPNATRASAGALAQCCNWVVNIIIALTTPSFLQRSPSGPYFLFGFFCILGACLGLLMPETKGHSLQQIDQSWDKKSAQIQKSVRKIHRIYQESTCQSGQTADDDAIEMGDMDQSAIIDDNDKVADIEVGQSSRSSVARLSMNGRQRVEGSEY